MLDNLSILLAFAAGLTAGSLAPTYFAAERLRGFGRWLVQKIPYAPPPGESREEAMQEAADPDNSD